MNYIGISLITTVVLFYLLQLNMQSSKQSLTYRLSAQHVFGDVNVSLVENFTLQADVAGWITDVTITANFDDWSHDVGFGVMIGNSDDWGELDDVNPTQKELMRAWELSGHSASIMAKSVPKFFFVPIQTELADNAEYTDVRRYNLYNKVDAGDNINVHFFLNELNNTLTTGVVNWVIKFEYVIGCYSHKNRGSSIRGSEVAILASMFDSSQHSFWTPPSNGRVGNIRLTVWGNMSDASDYVYFGDQIYTDIDTTQDSIEATGNGVYVHAPNTAFADNEHYAGATNYSSTTLFMKKAELLHLKYSNTNTEEAIVLVEFTFIPDFDKQVDFNIQYRINNIASDSILLKVWQIPFDMFVETLDVEGRLNDPIEGEMYIMGLKDIAEVLSTSTILAGSMLGGSGVEHGQSSVLPSNILETITFALNQNTFKSDDPQVDVYDYYHAGTFIMFVLDTELAAGTEDMDFTVNISGKSRVKSNRFGDNFYSSSILNNLEAIE